MRFVICFMLLAAELVVGGIISNIDRRNLTSNLDVPYLQDVDVAVGSRYGLPLDRKKTIVFFHILQREIYRKALVTLRDDVVPPEIWDRDLDQVGIRLIPIFGRDMTWGEVLYAIQTVLRKMLYPSLEGHFREQTWLVFRRQGTTRLGNIASLIVEYKLPSKISGLSPAHSSRSESSVSATNKISLAAPFPIPGSDLSLLIGSRGGDLPPAPMIQGVDGMIAFGYRELVVHHESRPVNTMRARITDLSGVTSSWLKPRSNRGVSVLTDTDLVEMCTGVVLYAAENGYFATTITAVRTDIRGKRVLLGSMEFSLAPIPIENTGSTNSSSVETS
ncbi:MAG: hypothetical protein LQ350_004744 [Teloschistes chrysophthalmus]|nr:MAG: hypothetical protein LQ350_004744 [Niorma chrysophthalma]